MKDFEAALKKCRFSISQLEKENAALAKKAAEEKERFAKQLEGAKLQADYYNLRRFVDSLPEEVKRQARTQQKFQNYQL